MGQLALGFRSLLTKAAVFFVMAALLAWALGGTLWPKPHVFDDQRVTLGGTEWWWRLTIGGNIEQPQWTMMRREAEAVGRPYGLDGEPIVFSDIAESALTARGVIFGGRSTDPRMHDAPWHLFLAEPNGRVRAWPMPDRLALERQIQRLKAGLEVQDYQTILSGRSAVLDPADDSPGS